VEEELPLTPAMIDWAQSPIFRPGLRSVSSLVIFVFLLCFTAPAFLSAVVLLRHRPLGAGAAVVWAVAGVAAIGFVYAGLRSARLVRRDLARGIYVRWTGPFTLRLVNSGLRASKGLEVKAGGRTLRTGGGDTHLPPPGIYNGTVEYLPASNTLCEVRTGQGTLLWSQFVLTDSLGAASPPSG